MYTQPLNSGGGAAQRLNQHFLRREVMSKKEKPKGEWVVDISSVYGLDKQTAADIRDEKINVEEWLIAHVKGGIIEVVNIFGGASLIVPSDWKIKLEMVSIFGGFSDKRHIIDPNPQKTLIVKGVSVFGGGDIKNLS